MNRILNVAIIGCGRVAGHHARSIAKIPEKMKLVAVCDLVKERAEGIANTCGIPAYLNYYQMMEENPQIDIVAIITPSGMHFEHAIDIIKNYKKHVVVEKPMVMRLAHGEILKKTALENGVKVFPVFQYRFNKSVQRVKKAIAEKEMGDLVLGTIRLRWCRPQRYYDRDPWRGTFALDGGACTNQGIHHLDLMRYLAGDVKRVNSLMSTLGASIEVEDTVVATIEFTSGALGVIEITTAARPDDFESSISFVGSKGLAMVGGWATNELIKFSLNPEEEKIFSEVFPDVYGFGHKEIYNGVYNSIINDGKPAVEYDDAMGSIRLLHSLYSSDERKNWVNINDNIESKRLGSPNEAVANLYRTKK
jgi:UDP-N-acetyl-2-amino-2-deoxyglucuronate dehydrogenase